MPYSTAVIISKLYFFWINVQVNVFLSRLNGEPIGFSVLGIFIIDKNTILTVNRLFVYISHYKNECNIFKVSDI